MTTPASRILLTMPHNGSLDMRPVKMFWTIGCRHAAVTRFAHGSTLLAKNFNILLSMALTFRDRGQISHLAMFHDDVLPDGECLNTLHEELVRTGADLVSAVVAIKDDRGLTSTAIDDPLDRWCPAKRFTMAEIMELPETFTAKDTAFPDRALLVNTGCWMVDLRKPIFNLPCNAHGESPLFFTVNDRIVKQPDGVWRADCESEDWFFSKQLFNLGGVVAATRKVATVHIGARGWNNNMVWGRLQEDDYGSLAGLRGMSDAQLLVESDSQSNRSKR